jgi:uncharacterized protein YndB with AHSA1/START domain
MNLYFDFAVDKASKTIRITREFAADLDLVWDAFTKAEILDRWQAPKPFQVRTKEMDFREGGRWVYAMITPERTNWSKVEFLKIAPKFNFSARNSFCDENGNTLNNQYSLTTTSFKPTGEITTVIIEKVFTDLSVLEMMASNGFKEGMAMAMSNLDEYFSEQVVNNN